MFNPPRRIALFFSSLLLLGLFACVQHDVRPDADPVAYTVTITIVTKPDGTKALAYSVDPNQPNPTKLKVRPKDTVDWVSDDGIWMVVFEGETPLVQSGNPNKPVHGVTKPSKKKGGGKVRPNAHAGDEFKYSVSVYPPGAAEPVEEDPRIIIQ